MSDWKQDPKLLRYKSALELPLSAIDRANVLATIEREIPRAKQRAQMQIDYNPVQAAAISAGSEAERVGEGARMLFGGPETVAKAQADRAERERIMAPLEAARPTATIVGRGFTGAAVPGGTAGGLLRRLLSAGAGSGAYEGVASGGDATATAQAAAFGSGGAGFGHMMNRFMFGNPKNIKPGPRVDRTEHKRRMHQADALGLPVTPAVRQANQTMRQFEESQRASPFSSEPFSRLSNQYSDRANEIARKEIGMPGDDLITDEVLESAHDVIGEQFNRLVGPDKTFQITDSFYDDLAAIEAEYGSSVTRGNRFKPIAKNLRELADDQYITAKNYQRQASDLAASQRAANRGENSNDPALSKALGRSREALDKQFDQSFGDLPELKENRAKYRALRSLEQPNVIRQGEVSLPTLYSKLKKEGRGRVRGDRDLDTAAKVGHHIMSKIGDSGTATRMSLQNLMNASAFGRAQMLGGNALSEGYLNTGGVLAGPGVLGYMPRAGAQFTDVAIPLLGRQYGQAEARGEGLLGDLL